MVGSPRATRVMLHSEVTEAKRERGGKGCTDATEALPRGTTHRGIGYRRRTGRHLVVSYADKPRGSQGSRSETGSHEATLGKQTLVEQVFAPAPVVQQHAATPPDNNDETTVHAAAQRGVATPVSRLPFSDTIQRAFGRHDVSSIQAHTGSEAAASAQAMGADAYATGDHVVMGRGADLHTVAHEAAHVVQQRGGVQLKGGVGAAGDPHERHADAVADRVVAGDSAEDLLDHAAAGGAQGATQAVQRKEGKDDAKILEHQASLEGTDVEIPALEGALLSTRKKAVELGLLSQGSFDAGLALSQAMTQLQPAVAARGAVDRELQDRAAVAAQQLFAALQRETAGDKNFQDVPSMVPNSGGSTSQNPYTGEVRATTFFLFWSNTHDLGSWLQKLPGLIRQGKWADAFHGYRRLLDGLDLWVADQLRKKGKGTPEEALGNAQQHYAQLRTGLEQIADKHATRLPALFHPDPKTVEKEKAAGRPAADAIPMNVYFWKDAADGKFHLYDLTTPSRPHEQTVDGPPTAAMMSTFFEEVARYPEGEVRFTLPGGAAGVAPTTGKTKWYEWVAYAGLAIAAVGLAFLTAGASIPATVCFAAGAVAGGVSAAGHLVDTATLGTATTATVVLDVAQIVASFASFGAMSITLKAGSAAAALAGSRWFVPLVSTAAGADVVQMVAFTDVTFNELTKIRNGTGSPEDKQRAMAVLFTQLIVMGGLTALSVQGARNARALAGKPLEVIDRDGRMVLRVVGEDTPATTGSKPVSEGDAELTQSAGKDRATGAKADDVARVRDGQADVTKLGRTVASHSVELLGESHTLRVVDRGNGELSLVLCSNCGFVRGEIDAVLAETSAKGPTKSLRVRLERLRANVADLETRMTSGEMKQTEGVAKLEQIAAHLADLSKKFPSANKLCTFCSFKGQLDYDLMAKNLGFERTGARSHGQPVYRRGNELISPDVDRHNGGIWKKATGDAANLRNKTTRDGTFNEDLTEMVGP
jgi:Novel toxin 21/Domain of unknown function (DUF4157)